MKILGVLIEHGVFNNTPFSYLANDDQNISIGFFSRFSTIKDGA